MFPTFSPLFAITKFWEKIVQLKGLNFPGSQNPQFCRLVIHRSRHLLKPVRVQWVKNGKRLHFFQILNHLEVSNFLIPLLLLVIFIIFCFILFFTNLYFFRVNWPIFRNYFYFYIFRWKDTEWMALEDWLHTLIYHYVSIRRISGALPVRQEVSWFLKTKIHF